MGRNDPLRLRQESIRLLSHWGEVVEKQESLGPNPITKVGEGGSRSRPQSTPLISHQSRDFNHAQRLLESIGEVNAGVRGMLEVYAREGCVVHRAAQRANCSVTWARTTLDTGLFSMDLMIRLGV